MNDEVKHPSHYTNGTIECIKAIEASMTEREFAGYCKGNIIKYLWRYENKGGVQDLHKASEYLTYLIELESDALDDQPSILSDLFLDMN